MAASEWAQARLGQWLRDHDADRFSVAVEELREAVEHFTTCDGVDRTCELTADCRRSKGSVTRCDRCAKPCEDCRDYRAGREGTWAATRPALSLVDEIEIREAALFESADA